MTKYLVRSPPSSLLEVTRVPVSTPSPSTKSLGPYTELSDPEGRRDTNIYTLGIERTLVPRETPRATF